VRSVEFDPDAFEDFAWWATHDRGAVVRIVKLIREIQRDPENGIGKPERLKHDLAGCWSRRIDQEHRIVYEIKADRIRILSCRNHY
jgi:toxin YoeB